MESVIIGVIAIVIIIVEIRYIVNHWESAKLVLGIDLFSFLDEK